MPIHAARSVISWATERGRRGETNGMVTVATTEVSTVEEGIQFGRQRQGCNFPRRLLLTTCKVRNVTQEGAFSSILGSTKWIDEMERVSVSLPSFSNLIPSIWSRR